MKKIIFICAVGVVLISLAIGLTWWYLPTTFLADTESADVARIEVFSGTTGQSFAIEDRADIEYIVTKIQDVKMKKTEYSQVDGFVYSLSFYATDGTRIDGFILNGSDTIRDGAVRYEAALETDYDALCFAYIKDLEEAQRNQETQ